MQTHIFRVDPWYLKISSPVSHNLFSGISQFVHMDRIFRMFKGNIENSTKHGHGENMSGINIREKKRLKISKKVSL